MIFLFLRSLLLFRSSSTRTKKSFRWSSFFKRGEVPTEFDYKIFLVPQPLWQCYWTYPLTSAFPTQLSASSGLFIHPHSNVKPCSRLLQSIMARLLCFAGQKPGSFIFHCGDGFHYHYKDISSVTVRLRCRHYSRTNSCGGSASVKLDDGLLRHQKDHNHDPDPLLEDDCVLRRNMIEEARTSTYGTKIKTILINWRLRYDPPHLLFRRRKHISD